MARLPKIRVNYASDAAFLMRLSDAIGRDDRRPLKWRQEAVAVANQLAVLLLKADGQEAKKKAAG